MSASGFVEKARQPAVAGHFYPGSADQLQVQVSGFIKSIVTEARVLGAVMPHAGYVYSGSVAGETVSHLAIPETVIILGPNHTGLGPAVSVFPEGKWLMPFGSVPIAGELAKTIVEKIELAEADESAHLREHSIEVQLPFLHYQRKGKWQFVPITLSNLATRECRQVGESLAGIIREAEGEILLVASSDMTHYESHQSATTKDAEAIERILDLDPEGLIKTVFSRKISMCGIIPTAVMLYATKALGATGARLIRYTTSGETSGDYEQVVGYAGILVHK
jgi:AmmeMemoRadiSam system protein B